MLSLGVAQMIWCAVPNWPKYEVNELGEVRRSGRYIQNLEGRKQCTVKIQLPEVV